MKRPADLVWRANAECHDDAGRAPRHATTSASASICRRAAPAPSRKPDATVVCATALDPALADRLADDVIRRIDRRARIERERRGRRGTRMSQPPLKKATITVLDGAHQNEVITVLFNPDGIHLRSLELVQGDPRAGPRRAAAAVRERRSPTS